MPTGTRHKAADRVKEQRTKKKRHSIGWDWPWTVLCFCFYSCLSFLPRVTLGFQHFGRFLFHKVKIIQISLLLKACWHVVHSWKYKRIICGLVTEYGRKLTQSRHKLFISLPCWARTECIFLRYDWSCKLDLFHSWRSSSQERGYKS